MPTKLRKRRSLWKKREAEHKQDEEKVNLGEEEEGKSAGFGPLVRDRARPASARFLNSTIA